MEKLFVRKFSISKKFCIFLIALISVVLLPQVVHFIGQITSTGTALAKILNPMQLPIIIGAIILDPTFGFLLGAVSPCISFAISSMPSIETLPFMMLELATYGFILGYLANKRYSLIKSATIVIFAQVFGRVLRYTIFELANNTFFDFNFIINKFMVIPILIQFVLVMVCYFLICKKNNKMI